MKTIPHIFFLLFPLTLHAAEPAVELAGVQVVFNDGGDDFDSFKTFNAAKGHRVALIVRSNGKQMVGFDDDDAALTIGGAKAKCRFFGGKSAFSKDRQALRLEFDTEDKVESSADGALAVKGGIPVSFATGKAETKSEPFAVAKGAVVKFPADAEDMPKLKIKSTGKPKWGDAKLEIEFATNRKIDDFAGIRFLDKDGKEIESDRGSSSWMSMMGKGSGTVSYNFKSEPEELILVVETWTGREEKTIAVDLKAGLLAPSP